MFGDAVAKALKVMRLEKEENNDELSADSFEAGQSVVSATEGIWDDVLDEVVELMESELPKGHPQLAVWWYSILIYMKKDAHLFLQFIRYVHKNMKKFSINTNYFLFYQLKSLSFDFAQLQSAEISVEIWNYFQDVVEMFRMELKMYLEEIPFEKRNNNKVIVLSEQIIDVQHGPTKTALDRCKCLKKMEKEVLLINTCELLSQIGEIPFYGKWVGNKITNLRSVHSMQWKGVTIPFFQCENHMPDLDMLVDMIKTIREIAPQYIVAIGGSGMLCNLVNKMIPVVTVGLCPSDFEYTTTQFQTLGRQLNDADRKILRAVNYSENRVIESVFTSSLKPQEAVTSRKKIGLPEDKFLLVTVGTRLDNEITSAFMEMLETCMSSEMYWVIIGEFNKFEYYLSKYPKLKHQTIYLGFCNDVLSRLELCDLYVNPIRRGGGTSCVEALYKGIPVVSVDYGDVAINAGKAFCMQNYKEMKKAIIRYSTDKSYYENMHQKALQRSEILLDTDREFVRIMQEVDRREKAYEENLV